MPKWIKQWDVSSSSSSRTYKVSLGDDGTWACGCIGWTRHVPRKDCKHIKQIKAKVNTIASAAPSQAQAKPKAKFVCAVCGGTNDLQLHPSKPWRGIQRRMCKTCREATINDEVLDDGTVVHPSSKTLPQPEPQRSAQTRAAFLEL